VEECVLQGVSLGLKLDTERVQPFPDRTHYRSNIIPIYTQPS